MTTKSTAKSAPSKKKAVLSRLAARKGERKEKTMDLVAAIKRDHKDLKRFLKTMKDETAAPAEKRSVVEKFVELLKSHAPSEETALYARCVDNAKLSSFAHEGYVEHEIASALMKAIDGTSEQKRWVAEVKVLAEAVEHHIEEEESDFLPKVKKAFSAAEYAEMSRAFLTLREKSQPTTAGQNAGALAAVTH